MKLHLTLQGPREALANHVAITLKNERLFVTSLTYDEDIGTTAANSQQNIAQNNTQKKWGRDPRVVFASRKGRTVIDAVATLKNLQLTEEQLDARGWRRGSLENAVKNSLRRRQRQQH